MAQESAGFPPEPDLSADVVIIGSGATGLPAAIAAAEEARVRDRFAMRPAPERHTDAPETRTQTQGEPP